MKRRPRLGLLLVAATTIAAGAGAVPAPVDAAVDTTPPAIGSCFDMTRQEVTSASNDNAPVPCSTHHSTMTFDIVEFAEPPDWNDEDSFASHVYDQCNLSWISVLGGSPRSIGRSSFDYYYLLPTPAQRDAGAAWVRCELVLQAGDEIAPMPEKVSLSDRLPLPDAVARCRESAETDYRLTVCSQRHEYRAKYSFRLPWTRWRGAEASKRFSYRQCDRKTSGPFNYQWQDSKYWFRLGFRYAICSPKTHH